jgi:hypothetical protein
MLIMGSAVIVVRPPPRVERRLHCLAALGCSLICLRVFVNSGGASSDTASEQGKEPIVQTQGHSSAARRKPGPALDGRRDLILFIRDLVLRQAYAIPGEEVADHIMREALAVLPATHREH